MNNFYRVLTENTNKENSSSMIIICLKYLLSISMIISPSIGYIIQAKKFKDNKSSKGFSKYLILILLIANILRIFFWFWAHFTGVVLIQSIIVIISQFYLLHISLLYEDGRGPKNFLPENVKNQTVKENKNEYIDYDKLLNYIKYFFNINFLKNKKNIWRWKHEYEYYKFTLYFVIFCWTICGLYGYKSNTFMKFIGYVSSFTESTIAIPQIKENYTTKNTKNLSFIMILLWLIGDLYKTIFYICTHCPISLILGGSVQITLDIVLCIQLNMYGKYKQFSISGKNNKYSYNGDNNNETQIINGNLHSKENSNIILSSKSDENINALNNNNEYNKKMIYIENDYELNSKDNLREKEKEKVKEKEKEDNELENTGSDDNMNDDKGKDNEEEEEKEEKDNNKYNISNEESKEDDIEIGVDISEK